MKIQKFLIAGGNSTLLVWEYPKWKRPQLIKRYLGEIEQIGFVKNYRGLASLEMMGGELCVNATIALSSQLGGSGKLKTSGINKQINFNNKGKISYLKIPLQFIRKEDFILFPGIGFVCSNKGEEKIKGKLNSLANKYSLPAFGLISFQDNKIKPFVYVKETDSLIEESACGSGSIAYSIFSGNSEIIHPTGQSILVRQRGDIFIVGAKVDKIGEVYD